MKSRGVLQLSSTEPWHYFQIDFLFLVHLPSKLQLQKSIIPVKFAFFDNPPFPAGGFFPPIWKICWSQIGSFLQNFSGWNIQKSLSCHHYHTHLLLPTRYPTKGHLHAKQIHKSPHHLSTSSWKAGKLIVCPKHQMMISLQIKTIGFFSIKP